MSRSPLAARNPLAVQTSRSSSPAAAAASVQMVPTTQGDNTAAGTSPRVEQTWRMNVLAEDDRDTTL